MQHLAWNNWELMSQTWHCCDHSFPLNITYLVCKLRSRTWPRWVQREAWGAGVTILPHPQRDHAQPRLHFLDLQWQLTFNLNFREDIWTTVNSVITCNWLGNGSAEKYKWLSQSHTARKWHNCFSDPSRLAPDSISSTVSFCLETFRFNPSPIVKTDSFQVE